MGEKKQIFLTEFQTIYVATTPLPQMEIIPILPSVFPGRDDSVSKNRG